MALLNKGRNDERLSSRSHFSLHASLQSKNRSGLFVACMQSKRGDFDLHEGVIYWGLQQRDMQHYVTSQKVCFLALSMASSGVCLLLGSE